MVWLARAGIGVAVHIAIGAPIVPRHRNRVRIDCLRRPDLRPLERRQFPFLDNGDRPAAARAGGSIPPRPAVLQGPRCAVRRLRRTPIAHERVWIRNAQRRSRSRLRADLRRRRRAGLDLGTAVRLSVRGRVARNRRGDSAPGAVSRADGNPRHRLGVFAAR